MSENRIKLDKILSSTQAKLAPIIEKTQILGKLNRSLYQYIDPVLAEHCQVANYYSGKLVIAADSAAWEMHLRYMSSALLRHFRQIPGLASLATISTIVIPELVLVKLQSPQKVVKKISQQSALLLKETAKGIAEENLRRALEKLAAHV